MIVIQSWAPTVLACRCGRGMRPTDMRRLPPLVDVPTAGIVIDPIVCPSCVDRREREIAALAEKPVVEDIHAVPAGAIS